MADGYRTVKCAAESEFTEKKSVFISDIFPCGEFEEAGKFIEEVKKRHPEAKHIVWAFINREGNVQRFSDAGEPKGTAGLPALEVLKKEDLRGVLVTVTRYFGGILLGAGGLSRAYARAARDAEEKAGTVTFVKYLKLKFDIPYGALPETEYELKKRDIPITEKVFGEKVGVFVTALPEEKEFIDSFLSDTAGEQREAEFVSETFAPEKGL